MAKRKRPRINTPSPRPEFIHEQEAIVKAVHEVARTKHFATRQEAVEFLSQFIGMNLEEVTAAVKGMTAPPAPPSLTDERFQEAINSPNQAAIKRKLAELLEIDPDHVHALLTLAMMERSVRKAEVGLRKAVAAGERNLGPLLHEPDGKLWRVVEARGYLEAKTELARALAAQERLEEAITAYQEVLQHNEGDNLGVCNFLLPLLLEARRHDEAEALMTKYGRGQTAAALYSRALIAFGRQVAAAGWDTSKLDDLWLERQVQTINQGVIPILPKGIEKADAELIKALKFNPWCAIYLIKAYDPRDQELPTTYAPGSEEEAILYLRHHDRTWDSNPAAMLWLTLTAMPWLVRNGYNDELQA